MDFTDLQFDQICDNFLEAMEQGLAGEASSLQMLPTYIQAEMGTPFNEPVLVLDAGGTNFRVATVTFGREGRAGIENFKKYPMPGVKEEVDKDTFFGTMARYIKDLVSDGQKIGFCFSYPVRMFPDKDGRLVQFSKEIQAKEVVGELIGANLKLALEKIGAKQPGSIVILNDTVATMLAGKADLMRGDWSGFIGFILGTGTNCCYLEKNSNILKANSLDLAKSQIINVESGGFQGEFGGALDRKYDRTTVDPGKYTLEKMVSGRYLGGLCRVVIETAAADGLFSRAGSDGIKLLAGLTTVDLGNYLENNRDLNNPLAAALANGTDDDRVTLAFLIERMIERAGMLAAMSLTATVLKSGQGLTPEAPVCITAEGTTFYRLKGLRGKTEYYLNRYLTDGYHRYWKLVEVENATLIGAAVAGLTN
jgi:hexokinase